MINKIKEHLLNIFEEDRKVLLVIVMFIIIAILYAANWGLTCLFIKAITLCFGWNFSLGIATGIWLIIVFLKLLFHKKDK